MTSDPDSEDDLMIVLYNLHNTMKQSGMKTISIKLWSNGT
jgi:hypothetical protein